MARVFFKQIPKKSNAKPKHIKASQNKETCFRTCFLVLPYFHAARKQEMFLPCSRSKFCFLETKLLPVWQNWETLGSDMRALRVFLETCFLVLSSRHSSENRSFSLLAPSAQPITCKTEITRDLDTRVFPRLAPIMCICFELRCLRWL